MQRLVLEIAIATQRKKTKMKKIIFLVAVLVVGRTAYAQENPRFEVSADYSYARWNPSQSTVLNLKSLNGGGGSVVYNFTGFLGVKADLQGYGTQSNTFVLPVGSPLLPAGGTINGNGNLFTYTFGPVIKLRTPKAQPYFQTLFGGAHDNVYRNLFNRAGVLTTVRTPSNGAFAMVVGGGIDIPVSRHISIRPGEVDYLLTRFQAIQALPGSIASTPNQNSFRYMAGVNFTF